MHIVGLPSFTVEVDAKYIRGMLNNPDIQPNNAINWWIAGILLFDFDLVHVPGKQHGGPDGLSRRRRTDNDEEEIDDGWVDEVLELGVWVNTWTRGGRIEDFGVTRGGIGEDRDVKRRSIDRGLDVMGGDVTRGGIGEEGDVTREGISEDLGVTRGGISEE
jgi:hypothetical protein